MTRETSQLPMSIQERLQQQAAAMVDKIQLGGAGRIRMSNRGFTTPDNLEGDSLQVVVIDFVAMNQYYDTGYQRDNPNPPACFSISDNPAQMIPSENSPAKQADNCTTCPMNQFGSNGKGKACGNRKLLAVAPISQLSDPSNQSPDVWLLSLPPTSIRVFDRYVSDLASKFSTPPIGVVTEITLDTDKTWAAPLFKMVRPGTEEEITKAFDLSEVARGSLFKEPDVSNYTPPRGR